jgi:uncharacterized NAD(P)/FAD-binding protein YdhS
LAIVISRSSNVSATDFLPRTVYGDYLADTFTRASVRSGNAATVVKAAATCVRPGSVESGFPHSVELDNGTVRGADLVVLAMGNSVTAKQLPWRAGDPRTGEKHFYTDELYFALAWRTAIAAGAQLNEE